MSSSNQRIGFIGLGNVGASLAGNLLRHGVDLTVRDLNEEAVAEFVAKGARQAASPRAMAEVLRHHHHLPALARRFLPRWSRVRMACSKAWLRAKSGSR